MYIPSLSLDIILDITVSTTLLANRLSSADMSLSSINATSKQCVSYLWREGEGGGSRGGKGVLNSVIFTLKPFVECIQLQKQSQSDRSKIEESYLAMSVQL